MEKYNWPHSQKVAEIFLIFKKKKFFNCQLQQKRMTLNSKIKQSCILKHYNRIYDNIFLNIWVIYNYIMYDQKKFSILISSMTINNSRNLSGLLFLQNKSVQFGDTRGFRRYQRLYLYHMKFYLSLKKEKQVSTNIKIARQVLWSFFKKLKIRIRGNSMLYFLLFFQIII